MSRSFSAKAVIALVVAFSVPTASADGPPTRSSLLETVFHIARSDKDDVIYFRDKTVVRGTVLNETLAISTPYSMVKLDRRKCAGVSFEAARDNRDALVTITGNRLTGILTDRVIRVRIGSSVEEIRFHKELILYIILRRSANELDSLKAKERRDYFVMTNGDLLTGNPAGENIGITIDDGPMKLSWNDVRQIEMQGGDAGTTLITKKNKDVIQGVLDPEEITLHLDLGIKLEAVYKDKIARILVAHAPEAALAQVGARPRNDGEAGDASPTKPTLSALPRELELDLGEGVVLEMVLIPPGEFDMGSPHSEEGRGADEHFHRVRITKPFYLAKHETTQEVWSLLMGENPAQFKEPLSPVENVSWDDCQKFISKLGRRLPDRAFRLPSEAEWEYACRAGTITRFSFGESDGDVKQYAWLSVKGERKTHPVGGKLPNAWGLYDMHGNVWEWCADWYGEYEFSLKGVVSDPIDLVSQGSRVLRGGAWNSSSKGCRSAERFSLTPTARNSCFGFRVAMDWR